MNKLKKIYNFLIHKKWNIPNNPRGGGRFILSEFIDDYRKHELPFYQIHKIHKRGFFVSDWAYFKLNEQNYKDYLSNVQYYAMHPINGWNTIWIDDKLTLKYMCAGTELDKFMPKYYFQTDKETNLIALPDSPVKCDDLDWHSIISLLKKEKEIAVKRISGSAGEGFYRAYYDNNKFYLNKDVYSEEEFLLKLKRLPNYIYTEYLRPHKDLAPFCDETVNSIRYLVARIDGHFELVTSFIRFGTLKSNYVDNYLAGGVLCFCDEYGHFDKGNVIDHSTGTNIEVSSHPDNNLRLEGVIPNWNLIIEAVKAFDDHFPQLSYLGFDFAITDKNEAKIIEINSLSGIHSLQLRGSILDSRFRDFFTSKLTYKY